MGDEEDKETLNIPFDQLRCGFGGQLPKKPPTIPLL
jgi:hypothetical protein